MSTVKDALQIARINRTKQRMQAWWHANRCEACKERAAAGHPLQALFARLGAAADEAAPPEAPKTPTH
jgi:hypothetical protein